MATTGCYRYRSASEKPRPSQ